MPTAINAVLFRWEDSPSLRHHCGFCDRPLSHPGARSSCFGIHCEPCIRFHQAMFMRNRGHTCASCIGADEAHHKRHAEIAETLRSIYELCDLDISLCANCPSGGAVEFEAQLPDLDFDDSKSDATSEEQVARTKKERKKMKRLARAASRPRVLTQQEIAYVGDVLHPTHDYSNVGDGPRNIEEIEEIEKNLRYNAQVYNQGVQRKVLKSFGSIEDGDVDFDAEMQRILSVLKITELQLRNDKNKGLQGKDLKTFDLTVATLRKSIVEDLVLIKKEEMEVRMRRAGYFRCTNRASNEIIEERHKVRDWRTGLRIEHSDDDDEEEDEPTTPESAKVDTIQFKEQLSDSLQNSHIETPDLRHFEHGHKRVTSDGYVEEEAVQSIGPDRSRTASKRYGVVPTMKIVLPEAGANITHSKRGVGKQHTLNIVSHKLSRPWSVVAGTVTPSKIPQHRNVSRPPIAPNKYSFTDLDLDVDGDADDDADLTAAISASLADMKQGKPRPMSMPWQESSTPAGMTGMPNVALKAFPPLSNQSKSVVPDISPTPSIGAQIDEMPRPPSTPSHTIDANIAPEHPPVSQKKVKKAKREAKRKAKKQIEVQLTEIVTEIDKPVAIKEDAEEDSETVIKTSQEIVTSESVVGPRLLAEDTEETVVQLVEAKVSVDEAHTTSSSSPTSSLVPASTSEERTTQVSKSQAADSVSRYPPRVSENKFKDWKLYNDHLNIDELSDPLLEYRCIHVCPCRNTRRVDCPFHHPSHYVDVEKHPVSIVYVSSMSWSLGPYNRLRGAKLLKFLNLNEDLRGKMLIIDEEILPWLKTSRAQPPPTRLLEEYQSFWNGAKSGPLMKQEADYDTIFNKNISSTVQLKREVIEKVVEMLEPAGKTMCYCHATLPADRLTSAGDINENAVVGMDMSGVVECAFKHCKTRFFHRDCVSESNPHRVTRWYCAECEKEMDMVAFNELTWLDEEDREYLMARRIHSLSERTDDGNDTDSAESDDECRFKDGRLKFMKLFERSMKKALKKGLRIPGDSNEDLDDILADLVQG